jgi:predicted flap endonuclease-1-like 5' DNA nuclease
MRGPGGSRSPVEDSVNGFTFLALIALALGVFVAYRIGGIHARRAGQPRASLVAPVPQADASESAHDAPFAPPAATPDAPAAASASASSRDATSAELAHLRDMAEERVALFRALADARAETARYRQVVVDIERNAPPPLLDAPGTPDDLKLIVGVGPVIERMLYQMGIATYRQIARLTERDVDEIEARLREFPGRIRRDAWVTQARALHVGKYGSNP